MRVTTVANATVRSAPSAGAAAVAQLPLGSEVEEAGPSGLDKTWVFVRLDDGRDGWLQARLTRPLDPVWRTEVYDAIIADRLARKGDGFGAADELVRFIDRVAPSYGDPASRAQVELARLQALARAAAAVPFNGSRREPYASWIAARGRDVVYDEPGGRWIVSLDAIRAVHARQRETPAADDLAWFAVMTGLPGECEGQVPCYFSALNLLHGGYLREHPFGRHAADAMGAIDALVGVVMTGDSVNRSYAFNRSEDCQELTRSVEGLSSAVRTAKTPDSDATLGRLAAVRSLCQ